MDETALILVTNTGQYDLVGNYDDNDDARHIVSITYG
jgi:hypothetical protein